MMQTGAFLQLILTLAAITSRLSVLLTEVRALVQLCWRTSLDLLWILDASGYALRNDLLSNAYTDATCSPNKPSLSDQ